MDQTENIWAAPGVEVGTSSTRDNHRWIVIPQGMVASIILATIDINIQSGFIVIPLMYLILGLYLGFRHRMWAFLALIPINAVLYFVHVVAIFAGYRQPYVEGDVIGAIGCLVMVFPSGFGLGVGALLHLVWSSIARQSRPDGPR